MRCLVRISALALGAGLLAVAAGCATPPPFQSQLVSVTASGDGGGLVNDARPPAVSPDGTKVAFVSEADDIGPAGRRGGSDVYLRDLATGTTRIVSAHVTPTQGQAGISFDPVFSPDGTKIAFVSSAEDLGPLPPLQVDGIEDVFLFDIASGTNTLASPRVIADNDAPASNPAISPDGTKVAFQTRSEALGPPDQNTFSDVYLRDVVAGTTSLVSVTTSPIDVDSNNSFLPIFSPDGTKIVFESLADNLGPTDSNHTSDIYMRDLTAGTTSLMSTNAAGTDSAHGGSDRPAFSPDGTKLAFRSVAADIAAGDSGFTADIYLRNLTTGAFTRVSARTGAETAGNGDATAYSFSPDGTRIAFDSTASNLVAGDANGDFDVFVRDLAARTTTAVSLAAGGNATSNGHAEHPVFSPDGTHVAFVSTGTNLGPTDANGVGDVYVRNLGAGVTALVSSRADGQAANGPSVLPAFAGSANRIVYESAASDLGPTDTNDAVDLYLAAR